MKREVMLQKLRETLGKAGFFISEPHALRSISFDFVARRDNTLLICKTLLNIDAFSPQNSEELKLLASRLGAAPLVIGNRSSTGSLGDGIIYYRHGIPILTVETLQDYFLEGVPPFIYAAPGGLYVRLDGDTLKELRKERQLSLGTLAEVAGVSRRTIQMYEGGMGAMVDVAIRLEEFLDTPLVHAVDPFKYKKNTANITSGFDALENFCKDVFMRLNGLGYSVTPTSKSPFEALTEFIEMDTSSGEDEVSKKRPLSESAHSSENRTVSVRSQEILLTGVGKYEKTLKKKARVLSNISTIVEKHSVIFTDKPGRHNLEGSPVICGKELAKAKDPEIILELIIERSSQAK